MLFKNEKKNLVFQFFSDLGWVGPRLVHMDTEVGSTKVHHSNIVKHVHTLFEIHAAFVCIDIGV